MRSESHTTDVVIIGGGIGGLTAALSLHAAGIGAQVIESVREIRPLGVGINLLPHATRELIELGLGDELAATAISTTENVYLDQFGTRLWSETRGRDSGYEWPQYSVHRGRLQMLLLAAVRERLGPHAVRTGTRVEEFEQTSTAVHARLLDRATGTHTQIQTPILLGADGLHSTVRAALHPDQGPPQFSGVRMWRGMTETDAYLTGRSQIIANDAHSTRLIAYPISAPDDHGKALINWVCQVPVSPPGPLTQDVSWNQVGHLGDVLPYYVGWTLGVLDVEALLRGSAEIMEYPMVDRDPLPAWGQGRVTLLGDAAHPMYPVGANGASQAIVDARVLAYELATTDGATRHDVTGALTRYEEARREATTATVLANREMDRAERAAAAAGTQDRAGSGELASITQAYRQASGGDVDTFNARPSLTPPPRYRAKVMSEPNTQPASQQCVELAIRPVAQPPDHSRAP
jgi:2-polyprenyl-6-methoxyphenol hydroxylase-like FAD-dependent oxidoreductase